MKRREFIWFGGVAVAWPLSARPQQPDRMRRIGLAFYFDHTLRGAKPGNLPVQAPTKYGTVFNLKAAKALRGLLVMADEMIE